MAEIVVNRYATALFSIAKEQGAMMKFKEEASAICDILKSEPQYINLLSHPSVIEAQKLELIEEAFSGHVSDEFIGLMGLIIKKSRTEYLIRILDQFIHMAKAEEGLVKATITSAMPLTNQQIAQIKANIEQSTGKTIEVEWTQDASLIGGLIVRVGDKVVDGSIKGQMNALKSELNSLRLA